MPRSSALYNAFARSGDRGRGNAIVMSAFPCMRIRVWYRYHFLVVL